MAYVFPQVTVTQNFTRSTTSARNRQRAFLVGGHAQLVRFAVADERPDGRLGYYDRLVDTQYDWPNKVTGAKADLAYAQLHITDALLAYYEDPVSGGSTVTVDRSSGRNNRIRSATVSFADHGTAYPKSDALLDRGAMVGDVVRVVGTVDAAPATVWSYIKRFVGDPTAAAVAAATADTSNPEAQSSDVSYSQTDGPLNCVAITAADLSGYDGLTDGHINETYTVVCTQSSVDGDFTTARLRVISASGLDDADEVTPSAAGDPTAIGARGLYLTFDKDSSSSCSASAASDDVSPDDMVAGQTYEVVVQDDYSPVTATSGGTYTGLVDRTYVVTVSRGGLYAAEDDPQITVSTTTGDDLSGPTSITAAATPVAIGSYGATIRFNGSGLRQGDKYYVAATAAAEGPYRSIELGHSLPAGMADDSQVDLTLFIRVPELEVPKNRVGLAPLTNWDVDEDGITLNSGATAYDASWTDDGVQQPLEIWSAEAARYGVAYATYRAWRSDFAGDIFSVDPSDNLSDVLPGPIHPDNPITFAVNAGRANTGVEIVVGVVADPDDTDDWAGILEQSFSRDDPYDVVPLTDDTAIVDLFLANVAAASTPTAMLWRRLFVGLNRLPTIPIVSAGSDVQGHTAATTSDGEVATATVTEDLSADDTVYTLVTLGSDNVNFVELGVAAGDVYRTNYATDGFGGLTYDEYVVDDVVSENELLLAAGPDAPITVGVKFELWRNLTATQEAQAIGATAAGYNSRRVTGVWMDAPTIGGVACPMYFAAAKVACLASGVLPHQGLTHVEVLGIASATRSRRFGKSQLDTMAAAGVWIVTTDATGKVFNRHAVTTGDTDVIEDREEMIVRNFDSVSYRFKDQFDPYIGVCNVTPTVQARIEQDVKKLFLTLQTEGATADLGPQIIALDIVQLTPDPNDSAAYLLAVDVTLPAPLNNLKITLNLII